MTEETTIRLSKRVAEMVPCSRREAELYIEGAYVSVDGVLVEEAGARVAAHQQVVLAANAEPTEILPVTIVMHKPAGAAPQARLKEEARSAEAQKQRFLKRHFVNLTLALPMDDMASGLCVFTQDFRVARKLVQDADTVEQEIIVDVDGAIAENGLAQLNQGSAKVSWQNEGRLRFAIKGPKPGQIRKMCLAVGLKVTAMKRIRLGRIAMSGLPVGEWRYLQGYERF